MGMNDGTGNGTKKEQKVKRTGKKGKRKRTSTDRDQIGRRKNRKSWKREGRREMKLSRCRGLSYHGITEPSSGGTVPYRYGGTVSESYGSISDFPRGRSGSVFVRSRSGR